MAESTSARWVLAVNHASGPGERAEIDALTALFPPSAHWQVAERAPEQSFDAFINDVCRHCRESGSRLLILGGDGTANAFAAAAAKVDIAIGLLPGGTFNYAAQGLGIDADPRRAMEQLLDGVEKTVTLPEVNGRLFMVNLSLGLHREMIDTREELAEQIGRSRLTAVMGSLLTLFRPAHRLALSVELDHRSARKLRVNGLYVSGNPLLQRRIAQVSSSDGELGALTLATLRRPGLWSVIKGLMAGITDARLQVPEVSHLAAYEHVALARRRRVGRPFAAVLDGERVELKSPIRITRSRKVRFVVPLMAPVQPI